MVFGWIANSSSASIVVTRTFTGFGIVLMLESCSANMRQFLGKPTLELELLVQHFFITRILLNETQGTKCNCMHEARGWGNVKLDKHVNEEGSKDSS